MGHQRNNPSPLITPRGVKVRRHASKTSIQVAFTWRGRQCRETLSGIKADQRGVNYAERLLNDIRAEIRAGTFDYTKWFPNSKNRSRSVGHTASSSLRDFAETYVAQFWKSKERSTQDADASWLENRILPALGSHRLRDLTRAVVVAFLSEQGKTLSLKSLRNLATVLRKMLAEATERGYVDSNPIAHGRLNLSELVSPELRKAGSRVDPFTLVEMGRILAVSKGQTRNLIEFWRWTGLRTGEVLGLRWTDVDFAARVIRVKHNVVKGIEKAPKTRNGLRVVELCQPAVDALRQQQILTGHARRVFLNLATGLEMKVSHEVYREWRELVRRAGIRYRKPSQLRHTYASTMLTQGANIHWLAQQMGHGTSTEMLQKHYGKYIRENANTTVDDLATAILDIQQRALGEFAREGT